MAAFKASRFGLVGNRADHRQHATDGRGLFGQVLDHLRIALYFSHQRMQAGKTQADDFLTMFDRLAGMATGLGGLTGVAGDLLDGRLQFAKGVANHCRVAGLVFGTAVQVIAQFRPGFDCCRRPVRRCDEWSPPGPPGRRASG